MGGNNDSGQIAQYGLGEWWAEAFSPEDREWIADLYRPMGSEGRPLVDGPGRRSGINPYAFLTNLAVWVNKPGKRHLALVFAEKAESFYSDDLPVLARHFGLAQRCEVFYRQRDNLAHALDEAVRACERCIALEAIAAAAFRDDMGFLPAHQCFKQLCIIEEKRGNLQRAIELAEKARASGWNGDWEKRIAKLMGKLAKS